MTLVDDLEGVRVRHLDLLEVLVELLLGDVEAPVGDDVALIEGYSPRVAQRDELVVLLDVREGEAADEARPSPRRARALGPRRGRIASISSTAGVR